MIIPARGLQLFNKQKQIEKTQDKYVTNNGLKNESFLSFDIAFGKNVEIINEAKTLMKCGGISVSSLKKLFEELSPKIKENVLGFVERLEKDGLTFEKYLPISFFSRNYYRTPDNLEKRVRDFVAKFEENGLTTSRYIKAFLKTPSLLTWSPRVLERNVKSVVKKYEGYGLNTDAYIHACLKQPPLFLMNSEAVEANLSNFVGKFEGDGLTLEDYFMACVKQPSLFYMKHETIEKNIMGVVDEFTADGMTTEKYLATCVKRPSLFNTTPEVINEHIRVYMYIDRCKLGYKDKNIIDKVLRKKLDTSSSLIYLEQIIRPQLKKQHSELANLGRTNIKQDLKEFYAKHPEVQFRINIMKGDMAEHLIKTMQEFCEKELGKKGAFIYQIM